MSAFARTFSNQFTQGTLLNQKDNYYNADGIIIDDFNSLSDWTITGCANSEISNTIYKNSTDSIKITSNSIGAANDLKKTVNYNFLGVAPSVELWFYIETQAEAVSMNNMAVYLGKDSGNFFYINSYRIITTGWNRLFINSSEWNVNGTINWNNDIKLITLRPRFNNGSTSIIYLDQLRCNSSIRHNVIITFDDAHLSQYSEAYTYMKTKGIVGTIYAPSALIDTSNYCTGAQLKEMYADGWDIANHGSSHNLLDAMSLEEIQIDINAEIAYLEQNGMPRAARHLAYPGGHFNDTVIEGCRLCGIKTGRTILTGIQHTLYKFSENEIYKLKNKYYMLYDSINLASAKAAIDDSILSKTTIILSFHRIVETPTQSEDYSIANFRALIDYISSQNANTNTISRFYSKLKSI